MNPFLLAPLALAAAFCALPSARAQTSGNLPTPYIPVEMKQYGNTYQWTPAQAAPSTSGAVYGPNRGWSEISNAEPKINTYQKLPFDNRASIPDAHKVKIVSPFTKANFGKALTFGARQLWPIGAVIAAGEIYDYIKAQGYIDIANTPDGITAKELVEFSGKEYQYINGSSWHPSPNAACSEWRPIFTPNPDGSGYVSGTVIAVSDPSKPSGYKCKQTYGVKERSYSSVEYVSFYADISTRPTEGATYRSVTQTEIEQKIASESGWPSTAAPALQRALQVPGNHLETLPPTVTGPSSVPGTTTTTTQPTQVAPGTTTPVAPGTPGAQPATQTTTTTNTTNVTYNNNTATTNNVTNTTTSITNSVTNVTNNTSSQNTESDQPAEEPPEDPPTDTPLGPIPTLYERKYPDGLTGIWNTKSAELKATPLFSLADQLMPTGLAAGSCPSWQLDLAFGSAFGDYGIRDVSPPCWIWDIAKVIIIASALILARALVFGG